MLIDFKFKNYKSFREEQYISFVASLKKEYLDNLIACDSLPGINLLPSIVVYGANASGKTNIINALYFCQNFIRNSAKYEINEKIPIKPFLLDEVSKSEPSEFEFSFIVDKTRYQYGFTVNRNFVEKEWLISYPKGRARNLFKRTKLKKSEKYTYKFSSFLKGDKGKLIEVTTPNSLFLSTGATFNNEQLTEIYKWFLNNLRGARARDLNIQMFKELITEKKYLNQVIELIKFADLGVVDFSISKRNIAQDLDEKLSDDAPQNLININKALNTFIKEISKEFDEEPTRLIVDMVHSKENGLVSLPLEDESIGTIQFFSLCFPILLSLNSGCLLFVDELDSSLHPLLVKSIVNLFNDPKINKKGAQLLFNTHDTSLLNFSAFRRDQIWFTEKDKFGASHIYSLLEFSPRTSEALEKGYLQGRYGAIPFIGTFPCEVI